MRISRRIQLVGLAALAGGVTSNAVADDLITNADLTDPVFTATAAGAPADAGNVTIQNGGSITVTAGEAAITVDSNNDVTTDIGSELLSVDDSDNVIGIRLNNGFSSPNGISHGGTILFTDNYEISDTDGDGDDDTEFATGANRTGIYLENGTFTGDLTVGGLITIEGNSSHGIWLDGLLVGDLEVTGPIGMLGDNNVGVLIDDGVTGSVALRGSVGVVGEGSSALIVDGDITGSLRLNGSWFSTGYHNQIRPVDTSQLDPLEDFLQAGSTIAVHNSVAGGFVIEGQGSEDDPDDDGDGVTEDDGDGNDDLNANIRSAGSAPAIEISTTTSNIILGAITGGDAPAGSVGFFNRGIITADGIYDGFTATGILIEGDTVGGFIVDLQDGFVNDGTIGVSAVAADSFGVIIGENVLSPTILNTNAMGAVSITEGAHNAYGLVIDADATVNTLNNSGTIRATLGGEVGNAYAIIDESGGLTVINNSGEISASTIATDSDLTDDIIPVAAGDHIAIDVSNSLNVTLTQSDNADADFTGELIRGDILFGGGLDTVDIQAGSIIGDIDFGVGADVMLINGGAAYRGEITDIDGVASINVADGTLQLTGGNVDIGTLTFGANSNLVVQLGANGDPPVIEAGSATFASTTDVGVLVPQGLPENGSVVFLTATQMFGGADVTGSVSGTGVPFMYDVDVELTSPGNGDGLANGLQATYEIKTAAELGLNNNQGVALDPILEALRNASDQSAANALTAIDNQGDFINSYEDLMPNFSSAAAEIATTAIQQAQSATSNRLAATRLHDLDDVSAWTQEIAYGVIRDPATANGAKFRGYGFGVAAGIDGPLQNGGIFGLSAAFVTSEVAEPGRVEGEISAHFGQANAYWGTAVGPIDLDVIGGVGIGQMTSRRFVEINSATLDFSALSEAEWWSYEGHAMVRASAPLRMADWFILTPQAALTYAVLNEDGYVEEGGGEEIDYDVDSATSQRLWGDVGVELSGRMRTRGTGILAPRLFVGYRANLIDEGAERTFRFAAGGDNFTLVDEPLGEGGPLLGLGIDATNGFSTFTLGYEGEFGDQLERHSLNASVRFRF
jgi:hypothetical protein